MLILLLQLEIMREVSTYAIVAGVVFFLIFAGVAYVAFRMLRKTVGMAFRMALVAAILLIALIGSVAIYWSTTSNAPARPRPQPTRSR